MTSKREPRDFRLSFFPFRPSLNTAGQQSSAPEEDLWRCAETAPGFDGMLSKRPGITQWGQTLKRPDPDGTVTARADFLSGLNGFVETDSSTGKIATSVVLGELRTSVSAGSSNENLTLSYTVGTLSSGDEWSLRFQFRGINLPAYGDDTARDTFVFRAQGQSGSGKEFAIWSGGLYWKKTSDNAYTLVTGSEQIGAGTWNTIEVRCDDNGGTTDVYMNDTLLESLTSADLADATLTGTSAFEFRWEVEGSGGSSTQYTTKITTPMYNDTVTDPFEAIPVVALEGFQYESTSGAVIRALVCAAGSHIYHDRYLEGCWRPLHPKRFANIHFSPYRTDFIWVDSNGSGTSAVWLWDGGNTGPDLLDDAPPIQYVTEHQQRLFGWGDPLNPRRLYYSGDRLPNVWFSPSPDNVEDDFDTILDAGYKEIPSRGRSVKAVVGDFYGRAVVAGENGFWTLQGSGPFTYQMNGLKSKTGAANALCLTQVGNDVWAMGAQGLTSVATTDKYGDIQASFLSIPVQDLWNPGVSSPTFINKTFVGKSRLVYNSQSAQVMFATALLGDQGPQKIFVYNLNANSFYGPWSVDATAITSVEIASPVTEVVMVGSADGKIGYFNPFTRYDFGSRSYTLDIESMTLNGRSLDPRLASLTKTWKTLRVLLLPRGNWDYTVTWWTDTDPTEYTRTKGQNEVNPQAHTLDFDFRLDVDPDARLAAGGALVMQEIPLDARGKELTWRLQQAGAGQDIAIQGIEIEGTVIGWETE